MATSQVTVNHEAQWARRTSLSETPGWAPPAGPGTLPQKGGAQSTAQGGGN